jgi:hypothetical protein
MSLQVMPPEQAAEFRFFHHCRELCKQVFGRDDVVLFSYLVDCFEARYTTGIAHQAPELGWDEVRRFFAEPSRLTKKHAKSKKPALGATDPDTIARVGKLVVQYNGRDSFMRSNLGLQIKSLFQKASDSAFAGRGAVRLSQYGKGESLVLSWQPELSEPRMTRERGGKPAFTFFRDHRPGTVGVSTVVVYPEARTAYFDIAAYLLSPAGEKVKKATLVQHSGTMSNALITTLNELKIPTTVYIQSRATVRRTLGKTGVAHHYIPQENNIRANTPKDAPVNYSHYNPIASLSAVWIDQGEKDSFLFLSWYVYWTFLGYDAEKPKRHGSMQFYDKDKRIINKIYGHDQPGIMSFASSDRGMDNGYQILIARLAAFIEHLEVESKVNPSREDEAMRGRNGESSPANNESGRPQRANA